VIGVYYFAMHWWCALCGTSAFAVRLPGATAVVASAGLTAVLGRRLTSWTDGLVAGLVFAVLPATARTGQDIRVYAFTILFALIATLALVRVTRSEVARRAWIGYAAALVAFGCLHLVAFVLLMPAHLVVLGSCARRDRSRVRRRSSRSARSRSCWCRWRLSATRSGCSSTGSARSGPGSSAGR